MCEYMFLKARLRGPVVPKEWSGRTASSQARIIGLITLADDLLRAKEQQFKVI